MSLFGGKKSESEGVAHRSTYGIDDAIRLMRTLPVDQNPDLVVHVIKNTLESLDVRLGDIIEEASNKQEVIRTRIADLRGEIAQLEQEVDRRKKDIAQFEADFAETTTVKDRLQLAEGSKKAGRPLPPPLASTNVGGFGSGPPPGTGASGHPPPLPDARNKG
jgi:hypothetical protein